MASAVEQFGGGQLFPCPYLRARGPYRLGHASRDHTCEAAGQGTRVRAERQSTVCLAHGHASCPTYLAAQALDYRRTDAVADATRRRFASTLPTVLVGPSVADLPASSGESLLDAARRLVAAATLYRLVVGVLAVLAVALFLLAEVVPRFTGLPAAATSSPSPAVSTVASPEPSPSEQASSIPGTTEAPSPSSLATPTARATTRPTARPTSKATPKAMRHYTVQAGDNLGAIARRFGTTVQAILTANGLSDPDRIYEGEVLAIPW